MNNGGETRLILVAEDDVDDRIIFAEALREAQITNPVEFVHDGVELMEYLDRSRTKNSSRTIPSLIVLDLNMPKKDGREVLIDLRSDSDFNCIPVIVFTTSQSPYDINRAYRDGANTYVCKPSAFDDLVNVLKHVRAYWFDVARFPQNRFGAGKGSQP